MNKIIYNLFLLFLTSIILYCSFLNNRTEGFVPKIIKEKYRPIERNVRTACEGFYNKTTTNISNFFRKFGIM